MELVLRCEGPCFETFPTVESYFQGWKYLELTVRLELIVDRAGVSQKPLKTGHRLRDERSFRLGQEEGANVAIDGFKNTLGKHLKLPLFNQA